MWTPDDLMYLRAQDGSVQGMLHDWDVALPDDSTDQSSNRGAPLRLPSVVPFTAIDLLTQKALDGKVAILYRHELESLIWGLVWRVCCYDDGKLVHAVPQGIVDWDVRKPLSCGEKKARFLQTYEEVMKPASQDWKAGHYLALDLLHYLLVKSAERSTKLSTLAYQARQQNLTPVKEQEADDPKRVWKEFWASIAGLTELVPCIAEFMPKDLCEAGDADDLKQST